LFFISKILWEEE